MNREVSGKYYWSNVVGYNYNWTNLQAALALAQLRRIDELVAYKKWLFHEYKKHLSGIDGLQLSAAKKNVEPTYWISAVIIDAKYGMNKEEIINKAKRVGTYEISIQPYEDCCSYFVPIHPETKAKINEILDINSTINLDNEYNEALSNIEKTKIKF